MPDGYCGIENKRQNGGLMKKIILSLLTLSLIYAPLSAFEWPYNSLTNSISNYWNGIKKDPAKVLPHAFLGGIAALLGYSMYKYYQKISLNGTITLGYLQCIGREFQVNDNVTIKQLKVAHQGYIDNYGRASCGYHALKNANYITYFLEGSGKLDAITDLDKVALLFGPDGSWRNLIKCARRQCVLKNYIYNNLKKLVKKEVEEDESDGIYKQSKIVDLFQTCLRDVASQYAMQAQPMTITTEGVQEFLLNALRGKMDKLREDHEDQWREDYLTKDYLSNDNNDLLITQENLKSHVCDEKTINRFIAQLTEPLLISSQDLEPIFSEYNKGRDSELSSNGNWLDGDEIIKLYGQQQESRRKTSLTVIENMEILDELDNSINENISSALATAREKLEDDDYIHKFILGTMSRYENSNSGTCGHWFTCVLFKHGSKHDYIIADSLNINRLQSPIVKKLIQQLEGQMKTRRTDERQEITKEESD